MITQGLILSLLVSGLLMIIAFRRNSAPVMMISSIGWMICALQFYQQTTEALPMLLLIALAAMQFFLVIRRDAR